jgi:hypothetical protein
VNVLWTVLFVTVVAAMFWGAYKIEPHYASKDGLRFLCNAQELADGEPLTRHKEIRVAVLPDGSLHCSQKEKLRRTRSAWTLVGKSPDPPRNLEVYVAQQFDAGHSLPGQLALRIPKKSRVVPVLDKILADRELRQSRHVRGTPSPAAPPDQD